jgi:hypothetical protein
MQTTFKLFFLFLICLSLTLLSGCGDGGSVATDSGSESATSGSEGESIANRDDVPVTEPAPSVGQPIQDVPPIPRPQGTYQAPGKDIFNAALWGTLRDIEHHISNGANINTQQPGTGQSPLHYAVANYDPDSGLEIVRYLIANSANVNVQANGGNTPLHNAAINPRADAEILRLLIANGADVNAKNGAGKTPLDFAGMNMNKSMVEEKQSIIRAAMKQ